MRLAPTSLMGRTALVLILAVAVVLGTALALFVGNRGEALSAMRGRYAAERIATLVNLLEDTSPEGRRHVVRRLDTPGLRAGWGVMPLVPEPEPAPGLPTIIARKLAKELEGREIRVILAPLPPPPPLPAGPPPGPMGDRRGHGYGSGGFGLGPFVGGPALQVSVRLADDSWLNVYAPIEHSDSLWQPRFVGPLAGALVVIIVAALWAVRRATRPLASLAAAAERLGMDVNAPPLAERGPTEVRAAAQAFNVMQGRIRRFVDDRTQMLAAISHDLRTPITRMKLRAEFVDDDEQRAKMLADLDEMEHMIAATLAFARDDAAREDRRPVDLAKLVQDMAEDLGGLYDGPDTLVAAIRPLAMKRALANVIENALKYGGAARVGLRRTDGHVHVVVDDDGPGIPESEREKVFAPFVRLETSRNRDTGGTGLGLAVARAAIRAHGGDITLDNRPQGGLRVTLAFPVG
ncbi:MAG: ATP-binding protein [Magnetospirillum sp.]